MIEILHDLMYHKPRTNGNIVYMRSGGICIIDNSSSIFRHGEEGFHDHAQSTFNAGSSMAIGLPAVLTGPILSLSPTVEARNLEQDRPPTTNQRKKEHQHKSSYLHAPIFEPKVEA